MSLQVPHREKQQNGVSGATKAVILVSLWPVLALHHGPTIANFSAP
jgi:hypothetical protein